MIKFFRKIRQNMITQNKVSKYLLYAIGEILLVVIGILIALQINSSNELKIQKENATSNLIQIHNELARSINNADFTIENYRKRDSLLHIILDNKVSYNDYKKFTIPFLSSAIANYSTFQIFDNGFESLMLDLSTLPIEYAPLTEDLKVLYKSFKKDVDHWNTKIGINVSAHLESLRKTKTWFADYQYNYTASDEIITYFLSDPFYKNDVAEFHNAAIGNHLGTIMWFRDHAINSYSAITKTLGLEEKVANNQLEYLFDIKKYRHWQGTYISGGENIDLVGTPAKIFIENDSLFINIYNSKREQIRIMSNGNFYLNRQSNIYLVKNDKNDELESFNLQGFKGNIEFKKVK
jgi:hypothetical protein